MHCALIFNGSISGHAWRDGLKWSKTTKSSEILGSFQCPTRGTFKTSLQPKGGLVSQRTSARGSSS